MKKWIWMVCIVWHGCKHGQHIDAHDDADHQTAIKVDSMLVAVQKVPGGISVTGTLEPEKRTELSANATGRVIETLVERGQKVAKDTVIAHLDVRSATLSVAEAKANLDNIQAQEEAAKRDCQRYDALFKKQAITQQEYDKATSQCRETAALSKASEARLHSAIKTVSDGLIRAPFAGIISERFINVGDYVKPESKVVTLIIADPLRLKLTIPEPLIGLLHMGAKVQFSPVAMKDKNFAGSIRFIGGEVRQTTRDLVVEAIVSNKDNQLLPGMFVTANIETGTEDKPVVPISALVDSQQDAKTKYIFTIKNKHLEQHQVLLGATIGDKGDMVVIESGLQPGETIVSTVNARLVDGALVE